MAEQPEPPPPLVCRRVHEADITGGRGNFDAEAYNKRGNIVAYIVFALAIASLITVAICIVLSNTPT